MFLLGEKHPVEQNPALGEPVKLVALQTRHRVVYVRLDLANSNRRFWGEHPRRLGAFPRLTNWGNCWSRFLGLQMRHPKTAPAQKNCPLGEHYQA